MSTSSLPRLDIPAPTRNSSLIPTPVSPVSKDTLADRSADVAADVSQTVVSTHIDRSLTALDALSTVAFLLGDSTDLTDEQLNSAYLNLQHTNSESAKQRLKSPIAIDPSKLKLTSPLDSKQAALIYTTHIDDVQVYITWINNSGLCSIEPSTFNPSAAVPIVRRVDTGFVNATLFLHAGGIETDQERSVILSLEKKKKRITTDRASLLRGFWIPLPRAVELSRTVSLDATLSTFLSDTLGEHFGIHPPVPVSRKRVVKKVKAVATIDPAKIMSRKRVAESPPAQAATGGKTRNLGLPVKGTFQNDFQHVPPTVKLDPASPLNQFSKTKPLQNYTTIDDPDETEDDA